jgi:hypothetical protein
MTTTALLLAALLLAPAAAPQADLTATTADGRKVILRSDGSWKFTEAAKPAAAPANVPSFTRPATATARVELITGKAALAYDPKKWRKDESDENNVTALVHSTGDGYAKIIAERIEMPLDAMRKVAISNARDAAPDMEVVRDEMRRVNGVDVLCLEMRGQVEGIPIVYFGYYYTGKEGSIQLLTYTGQNLIDEYQKDFEELLAGFEKTAR